MANPYNTDQPNTPASENISVPGSEKLLSYDWLHDLPPQFKQTEFVEVQFKSTRKGFYVNSENLPLKKGDRVAVEASPGHDIGVVSMTGNLVFKLMQKSQTKPQELKRIFRIATPVDMEKYHKAKEREHATMIESRRIAAELGLKMKIGDVEYLGDGNKAIFYYIADERVDFRTLIKILAQTFHIRIEMKQIGARQEAGRIGGIGPCGNSLCCAQWLTSFRSVNTAAARFQDLSMNPQKLTGQCGKLKCCTNYEVDVYMEARKKMPPIDFVLQTQQGRYKALKADCLSGMITYAPDKDNPSHSLVTISKKRAFEIIQMNKNDQQPGSLTEDQMGSHRHEAALDILDANSITRFDKDPSTRRRKKKNAASKPPKRRSEKPESATEAPLEGSERKESKTLSMPRDRKRTPNLKKRSPEHRVGADNPRPNRPPQQKKEE